MLNIFHVRLHSKGSDKGTVRRAPTFGFSAASYRRRIPRGTRDRAQENTITVPLLKSALHLISIGERQKRSSFAGPLTYPFSYSEEIERELAANLAKRRPRIATPAKAGVQSPIWLIERPGFRLSPE
jgi:hypothetical protein